MELDVIVNLGVNMAFFKPTLIENKASSGLGGKSRRKSEPVGWPER